MLTLGSLFNGISGWPLAAKDCNIKPVWSSEIDDFPKAVSEYHFPDVKELGDVTKINGAEIEPVDIICSGSPCFVTGTAVVTKSGVKRIENVHIGDYVITHTGKWQLVTEVMSREVNEIYSLTCAGCSVATYVTANHPYYVSHKCRDNRSAYSYMETPEWIQVKDMQCGDYIGYPIDGRDENPLEITKDECWLLGKFYADGDFDTECNTNFVTFTIEGSDKEDTQQALDNFNLHFADSKDVITEWFAEDRVGVSIFTPRLYNLCRLFEGDGESMDMILRLPLGHLVQFLYGLCSGNACVLLREDPFVAPVHTMEDAYWLQMIVHKALHIPCSIDFAKDEMLKEAPFVLKFNNGMRSYNDYFLCGGIIWQKIVSLMTWKEHFHVYNLEVEEDHSYTANGVLVHNCQDLSVAGKRAGLFGERSGLFLDSIRVAREMQEATDYEYPKFFVWENVVGSFSANKGKDILAVYDAFASLDMVVDVNLLDAQYMGVPQRRKRIFCVGMSAKFIKEMKSDTSKQIIVQFLLESLACVIHAYIPDKLIRKNSATTVESLTVEGLAQKLNLFQIYTQEDFLSLYQKFGLSTLMDGTDEALDILPDDLFVDLVSQDTKYSERIVYVCSVLLARLSIMIYSCRDYELLCTEMRPLLIDLQKECLRYATDRKGNGNFFEELDWISDWGDRIKGCSCSGVQADRHIGEGCRSKVSSKCKGLCRDIEKGCHEGQDTTRDIGESTDSTGSKGLKDFESAVGEGTPACIGNGQVAQLNLSPLAGTLNCMHDQQALIWNIGAYNSEGMKSSNPHSGIYEATTSRTLDLNGGNPACNQGGAVIVETVVLEGNGSRPSHKGDGWRESDTMYTLNTIERHGVAYKR